MLASATYFIILFTLQAIIIIKKGATWELTLIWGSLCFVLLRYRRRMIWPSDHPLRCSRCKLFWFWIGSLILLILSNIYLSIFISQHQYSALKEQLVSLNHQMDDQDWQMQVSLEGITATPAKIDGNRISFLLSALAVDDADLEDKEPVMVTHYIDTWDERERYDQLRPGEAWRGLVTLSQPDGARNPGSFDYRNYLERQGIQFVARVTGEVTLGSKSDKRTIWNEILQLREYWIRQTEEIFSKRTAPLVQAITVGQWDGIEPRLIEQYRDLGLLHLLAISGLHVGIVLGCLYVILSRLALTRETINTLLICFIPFYMLLSGLNVSVIRSGSMALILLLALRWRLHHHSLLGLYLVGLVMILVNPYLLFDVGFQLSFVVTFALLTMVPKLYPLIPLKSKRMQQVIAVTLVAELVSLPIILYHFHAFSPLSLLLNLFAVPIYSAVFIPGAYLLTGLSFFFDETMSLLIWAYEYAFHLLDRVLSFIYELPYALLHTGPPGWWWVGFVVVLISCVALGAERRSRTGTWLTLALYPVLVVVLFVYPYLDQRAYVTVLDVGQGDAIVLEMPYRQEVVLIDLGGRWHYYEEEWYRPRQPFEVGRDVLLPYLKYRGINAIDKVVISHGHFDHWGGLQGLLGRITIRKLLYPPLAPQTDWEEEWLRRVQKEGIPIYFVSRGSGWLTEHAQFEVLFPDHQSKLVRGNPPIHDYNLVIWNKIYRTTFMWTGDVEETGETNIIGTFPDLKVNVLKVAHHGSRTSSSEAWLNHVQPETSVVSVGRHNMYGHPHTEVIHRLEASGTRLFSTSEHGGIFIVVTPDGYEVIPTLQQEGESVQ